MVVTHNALVELVGKQREQTLAEDGLAVGFAKMQDIKAFLEKGCQYLILFDEEIGRCQ